MTSVYGAGPGPGLLSPRLVGPRLRTHGPEGFSFYSLSEEFPSCGRLGPRLRTHVTEQSWESELAAPQPGVSPRNFHRADAWVRGSGPTSRGVLSGPCAAEGRGGGIAGPPRPASAARGPLRTLRDVGPGARTQASARWKFLGETPGCGAVSPDSQDPSVTWVRSRGPRRPHDENSSDTE